MKYIYALLLFTLSINAYSFNKTIGKGYCTLRHPVEAFTTTRTTCESQHVIQQQEEQDHPNESNTIWINTTHHDYLDRSKLKPWENERPWNFGDKTLRQAYMMGTYANGYHYFIYDHHGSGYLTLFKWDGASHLLYLYSSVLNFITKEASYLSYQAVKNDSQWIDTIIGLVIDFFELAIGIFYGIVGMVVGTVLNPFDTVTNLFGLVMLGVQTTLAAVINTVGDVIYIASLGNYHLSMGGWRSL